MRNTIRVTRRALVRAGVPAAVADQWSQRFTAALPQLARIVAGDERDSVTYALAWAAEDAIEEERGERAKLTRALDLTRSQVRRVATTALLADDPARWKTALEQLATGAELAERLAEEDAAK